MCNSICISMFVCDGNFDGIIVLCKMHERNNNREKSIYGRIVSVIKCIMHIKFLAVFFRPPPLWPFCFVNRGIKKLKTTREYINYSN